MRAQEPSVWLDQGMKPETGREENTKGLNGVPNLILDQNSRSNEFDPKFVPESFIRIGAFTFLILSSQSLLVCI